MDDNSQTDLNRTKLPLGPLPPVPKQVRRHKFGDFNAAMFRELEATGRTIDRTAGETVPGIAAFGSGFAVAFALAGIAADYKDDAVFVRMSATQAREMGERIIESLSPVLRQLIEAELRAFRSELKNAERMMAEAVTCDAVADLEELTND